jgi:hypothetical protein
LININKETKRQNPSKSNRKLQQTTDPARKKPSSDPFHEEYNPTWDWHHHLHDSNTISNYSMLTHAQQKGISRIDKIVIVQQGASILSYKPLKQNCNSSPKTQELCKRYNKKKRITVKKIFNPIVYRRKIYVSN